MHFRNAQSFAIALISAGSLFSTTAIAQDAIVIGPDVPQDIARQDVPDRDYEIGLARWAWQQFVALGWKATYDPSSNNFQRGMADTSWSPDQGTPETVVWETYANRQELRPWAVPLTAPFDSEPNYLTQVRAEGRLVAGTDANGNPADFTLLNNLDEDNEIGSADIYLGTPTDTSTTPLVLYQAKTNRDEYDYFKTVFGAEQFDDTGPLSTAAQNTVANLKKYKAYFVDANGDPVYDICGVPPNLQPQDAITLPCGLIGGQEGAIEIKTAYMMIPQGEEANYTDFLVRNAIYYTEGLNQDGTGNGEFTYHNGNFALLGIHIIHKTTNFPGFIFTSFQQKNVEDMGFTYRLLSPLPPEYAGSNFNPHGATLPPNTPDVTQIGDFIGITRQTGASPSSDGSLYPVSDAVAAVNGVAQQQLGEMGSVWANYELIGVQANQTNSWAADASTDAGPNHFMANFVIESDAFLGNFFGPGFSAANPTFPTTDGNGDNSIYNGQTFNVGGCKGCHGVAATAFGTDSSFLLDFGAGKPVAEPDTLYYVPPAAN